MAINMTSAGVGVFARLGRVGRIFDVCGRLQGNSAITFIDSAVITDLPTEIDILRQVYAGGAYPYQAITAGLPDLSTALVNGFGNQLRTLQNIAKELLILQVRLDTTLPANTLEFALAELIRQMIAGGYYVTPSSAISAAVTPGGGNVGNGVVVVSMKDGLGATVYNSFAETIAATVTGGAGSSGSERIQLLGKVKASGNVDPYWPLGSGLSTTLSAVAVDGSASKVTNGSFEAFASNTPTGWTASPATPGTTLKQSTGTKFSGASSVEFDGNASELTAITQNLTGLTAKQPYLLSFAGKVDVAPAAGVLTVDLYNGASVINDEAGTANSFTVDLTTLGTSFVFKTGVFRLPDPLPATVTLRLRLSTALSNTSSLFLDHLTFSPMTELYTHGPWAAAISGSAPFSGDDTFSVAITNTIGSSNGRWQRFFERHFDMRGKRLLLPTSGSNLVNDNLLS